MSSTCTVSAAVCSGVDWYSCTQPTCCAEGSSTCIHTSQSATQPGSGAPRHALKVLPLDSVPGIPLNAYLGWLAPNITHMEAMPPQ